MAENDTGVLPFRLDEGDQVFGSLAVFSPAGFLQFLARAALDDLSVWGSDSVVFLSLPGLSQAGGWIVRAIRGTWLRSRCVVRHEQQILP